jgi:hypothetical protein
MSIPWNVTNRQNLAASCKCSFFAGRPVSQIEKVHSSKQKRLRQAGAFAFKNFGDGLLDYMEGTPSSKPQAALYPNFEPHNPLSSKTTLNKNDAAQYSAQTQIKIAQLLIAFFLLLWCLNCLASLFSSETAPIPQYHLGGRGGGGVCQKRLLVAAGPKLRKWYGEGERQPKDGGSDPEEEEEDEEAGESILVTDADTPTGELLLLQLMLARYSLPPCKRSPC